LIEQRKSQILKEQLVTKSEWYSPTVVNLPCNKLTAQLNEDWTELRGKIYTIGRHVSIPILQA
jgi:hypothetical protein